jgi:hypothetical protein
MSSGQFDASQSKKALLIYGSMVQKLLLLKKNYILEIGSK